MIPSPVADVLLSLALLLCGLAVGYVWGYRKGRGAAHREADRERQAAQRATWAWRSQPAIVDPFAPTKGRPRGVHTAPAPRVVPEEEVGSTTDA